MSNETMTLKVIAHIHTAFPTKFGIPRQSGLVDGLRGEIIFTPEYRNADALRGLEDFSHIWLVWQFSGAVRESWSPTVRPPRLGGHTRMGVFATRSPFRPNPLGLSSVRLEAIEHRPEVGPVLIVRGADLMDGTPIYDIKPYIPYADCHSDAAAGFTAQTQTHRLQVECPPELWETVPAAERDGLRGVLENDPRPSYQHDPERVYGMEFSGLEVHFVVDGAVLTVTGITRRWEVPPWNCVPSTPFCILRSCTAFPVRHGSWGIPSRLSPHRWPSWKLNWKRRSSTGWAKRSV